MWRCGPGQSGQLPPSIPLQYTACLFCDAHLSPYLPQGFSQAGRDPPPGNPPPRKLSSPGSCPPPCSHWNLSPTLVLDGRHRLFFLAFSFSIEKPALNFKNVVLFIRLLITNMWKNTTFSDFFVSAGGGGSKNAIFPRTWTPRKLPSGPVLDDLSL